MKNTSKNFLTLIVTILILISLDRLLLLYFGLPLWEWDEKLHYKHRPNITKYWSNNKNRPIKTNEYGHHDHSFPLKKKKNELRVLNLGDSITMGHGVSRDETYSQYMEEELSALLKNYDKIEVINAGVQGYSTFQELEVLKRSLIFEPDFVTVGFCLNDVTEPFVVNKNLGGVGLDYHKVTQAPNKYLSYILNETGFGRLIQEIRIKTLDANQEMLNELYDVKKMLQSQNDSTYQAQWQFTLNELEKIYSLCRGKNIKVLLLIFPYTFQFNNHDLKWAQTKLIEHADKNKVQYVNFLEIFEREINSQTNLVTQYFLDEDHLTPAGHKFAAHHIVNSITKSIELNHPTKN